MLGWELPPSISGGLGVACDGLLRGLCDTGGLDIDFMLPAPSRSQSRDWGNSNILDLGGVILSIRNNKCLEKTHYFDCSFTHG